MGKRNMLGLCLLTAVAMSGEVFASAPPPGGIGSYCSPGTEGSLERARQMMSSGNWMGAADALRALLNSGCSLTEDQREECDFGLARSLYELGDEGCVSLLSDFASRYPASTLTPEAQLLRGDYYFFAHEFGAAMRAYEETDIDGLDRQRRALYRFRLGVSQTKSGAFGRARSTFESLERDPSYSSQARFYLAYLLYVRGDYRNAYSAFSDLETGGEILPVGTDRRVRRSNVADYVPTGFESGYYLAQMEYLRGNYREASRRGEELIRTLPVAELLPETERITGESLFRLGHPDEARGYLERYMSSCGNNPEDASPTAVYTLGCILYSEGEYDESERLMASLADLNDDIGQSANLYLGQCQVRQGDRNGGALAFDRAYRLNYDRTVSESALYNYVAARTRGGNVPFSSSIPMMEDFLQTFPDSKFAPAVEEYLATAYFNEKDYRRAMSSIDRIKNPTAEVLAAKQKVAYELGAECLSNNQAAEAEKYMRIASEMTGQDARIARQALLWLGDAEYAQGKYSAASRDYRSFLSREKSGDNRMLAVYDLGYSLYREGKYREAAEQFRQASAGRSSLPGALQTDAVIRLADCLYYCGDTQSAIDSYSRAIDAGATDADYALLRRAMSRGSAGDQRAKISDLDLLLGRWPESKWAPQALLEKGLAYTDMGDMRQAMSAFERLASDYPRSVEARKGILNLAIARSESGDRDGASEAYKDLISRWPSSEEASMASDDLRKIYASEGRLRELAVWLKSVPGAPQLDTDEIERLAFDAAERALNDRSDDTSRLEAYVADYPEGRYLAQALYDLADVYESTGKYQQALDAADRLSASCPDARQTPAALAIKAGILEKHYPSRRDEALDAWREVLSRGGAEYAHDAYAGIMRTTPEASERLEYARRLRRAGGLSPDESDEAILHEGMALIELRRPEEGRSLLHELSQRPSSEAGARAAVELGENYLAAGDLDKAEEVLAAFTDEGSPHHYWLARGFIALADTYHKAGKTTLAREYLTSLRGNYPGDETDIREMIDTRLKNWKK